MGPSFYLVFRSHLCSSAWVEQVALVDKSLAFGGFESLTLFGGDASKPL
jgi:hypothetical protein